MRSTALDVAVTAVSTATIAQLNSVKRPCSILPQYHSHHCINSDGSDNNVNNDNINDNNN